MKDPMREKEAIMAFQRQFEDKVIAITGAASGIALATAHLLASRGAKLSLVDVSADALTKHAEEIKTKYSTDVISFPVDVRDYSKVEDWIEQTKKHFGKLDGAANLAGVIPKSIGLKGVDEQDLEEWDFVTGINLNGVMHCMRAQLRSIQDGGALVNASSVAGLTGRQNNAAYAASKHGVLGLTRSAAKEVGVRNVRVNCICPGRIETPMVRTADQITGEDSKEKGIMLSENGVALRRGGQPEEVAKLIAFLLSDESSYITGAAITIDGGWIC
ncbi:hypothetical protein LTR24_003475 [Lithohypha guttulata]|uniref:Uncharacterized protein n=1 Tax=Lithohypha guttulata TaxID=1690604 RepID=A0ABR0KFB4_9EURO|nr:hypothetical protein LTR24_003475 [Lithohypha guttulata]